MTKGGLMGLGGLAALLALTNGISCYQTLNSLDKYASVEVTHQKNEERRLIKGFPFDLVYTIAEGYGEKAAYWLYYKYLT